MHVILLAAFLSMNAGHYQHETSKPNDQPNVHAQSTPEIAPAQPPVPTPYLKQEISPDQQNGSNEPHRFLGMTESEWVMAVLTFIYVGLTAFYARVSHKTLKAIENQSETNAEQFSMQIAEAKKGAEAALRGIELQEVLSRQWVDVTPLETRPDKLDAHTRELRLHLSFNIMNPTRLPLTIEWYVIRIFENERHDSVLSYVLPPDNHYPVKTFTLLRDLRLTNFQDSSLLLPFVVTIGYKDAFDKSRKQVFGCRCRCGHGHLNVLPYDGMLPNDEIQAERGYDPKKEQG